MLSVYIYRTGEIPGGTKKQSLFAFLQSHSSFNTVVPLSTLVLLTYILAVYYGCVQTDHQSLALTKKITAHFLLFFIIGKHKLCFPANLDISFCIRKNSLFWGRHYSSINPSKTHMHTRLAMNYVIVMLAAV